MLHMVEIGVNIKTHDKDSLYAQAASQGPGPGLLVAIRTANFFGIGTSLKNAMEDATTKMADYIEVLQESENKEKADKPGPRGVQ